MVSKEVSGRKRTTRTRTRQASMVVPAFAAISDELKQKIDSNKAAFKNDRYINLLV
jgi:hypothetical protein